MGKLRKIGKSNQNIHRGLGQQRILLGNVSTTERNHLAESHDDQGAEYMKSDFKKGKSGELQSSRKHQISREN